MKNQTLVDWLVVSGGIHFEPDWDTEDEMKIQEQRWKGYKEGKRMGGRRRWQEERETGNMRVEDKQSHRGLAKWFSLLYKTPIKAFWYEISQEKY